MKNQNIFSNEIQRKQIALQNLEQDIAAYETDLANPTLTKQQKASITNKLHKAKKLAAYLRRKLKALTN